MKFKLYMPREFNRHCHENKHVRSGKDRNGHLDSSIIMGQSSLSHGMENLHNHSRYLTNPYNNDSRRIYHFSVYLDIKQ